MSRLWCAVCALSCAAALALAASPAVARDARETDTPGVKHKADTLAARPKHARHNEKDRQEKEHASKDPFGTIPKGPLQIIISIDQQRLHLYSDGIPVADATIATGVSQHPTPMGVFSVVEKERFHRSNIYSGAPMPFMQRITWSGVALHEGVNLGHPASHGCIRMPGEFAARLFLLHSIGARVVIARPELHPDDFADPHLFVHKDRALTPAPGAAGPPAFEPIKTAQTIDASRTTDAAAPSIPLASNAAAGNAAVKADPPAGVATPPAAAASIHAAATDGDPALGAKSSDQAAVASDDGNKTAAGDTAVKADPPATAAETSFSAAAEAAAAAVEAAAAEAKAADSSRLPGRENEEGARKADDQPAPAIAADTTASTRPTVSAPANIEPAAPRAPATAAIDPVPAAATQSSELAQPAAATPSEPAQAAAPASDDTARAPPEAAPEAVPVPPPKPAAIAQAAAPKATPITIFISRKLKRLYVRQNFAPLFDATIAIDHPERPLGTHVFTALEYLNDGATLRWNVISLPAQQPRAERTERQAERVDKGRRTHEPPAKPTPEPPAPTPQEALARIDIPPDVMEQISELIVPGSSLIVSDQDLGDETGEGTDFIVVTR